MKHKVVAYHEKENKMDTKFIETFRYKINTWAKFYKYLYNPCFIHCNVEKQLQLGTAKLRICLGDIMTGALYTLS